jgi:hypothetical protein
MRRLALLPILYLTACCSPAQLKQENNSSSSSSGEGTTSSSGGTSSRNSTSRGGTSTGGLTIPDSGPYDADAGKPADCNPISYPSPCTSYADCESQGYVCVADGCQPPACGQCGDQGQQACPFPLVCQNGSCIANPQGGGSGSNGGSGGASNGSGGASNGSGGASNGSGGASNGSGGASNGSGGASNGSGGASNGSGSGGASNGSGGASNGSGSGGASNGSGGASNGGSGGSHSSNGGSGASNGSGGASNGGSGGASSGAGHQPDGGLCVQDPNLQGGWNETQQYEMAQALATAIGGVVQAVNDIDQLMQLLQKLGAPIPSWVTTLMGDLLNLEYLLSQIQVGDRLVLIDGSNSMTYTAEEIWQNVTLVTPAGTTVSLTPNKDGGSGYFYFTSPPPYTVTTCSGVATFDQHDLEGALAGIIPPLLDAITQLATCNSGGPCYYSFNQAISAMIDCAQFTPVPDGGFDAGPIYNLGGKCSHDSDCTNCAINEDLVCRGGTCKYGCENSYDCESGFYCETHFDGGPDCLHATVLSSSSTSTSGNTGANCLSDSDCNSNKPGSGTFCEYAVDDAGIPIENDAGQYAGTCTAGCNGSDNFACAATDVCAGVPGMFGSYGCYTVDTSSGSGQTVNNQQDTGCVGPGVPLPTDAGISAATALCNSVAGALEQELTKFLASITFNFGVATVGGTCTVQDATDLTNGVWAGDVVFVPITGTFSAHETSKLTDGG